MWGGYWCLICGGIVVSIVSSRVIVNSVFLNSIGGMVISDLVLSLYGVIGVLI